MKKDPTGKWIMEKSDKTIVAQMWKMEWDKKAYTNLHDIWFEVILGLLEHNGLEIKEKPSE